MGGAGALASVSGQGVAQVEWLLWSNSLCSCCVSDDKNDASGAGSAVGRGMPAGRMQARVPAALENCLISVPAPL